MSPFNCYYKRWSFHQTNHTSPNVRLLAFLPVRGISLTYNPIYCIIRVMHNNGYFDQTIIKLQMNFKSGQYHKIFLQCLHSTLLPVICKVCQAVTRVYKTFVIAFLDAYVKLQKILPIKQKKNNKFLKQSLRFSEFHM